MQTERAFYVALSQAPGIGAKRFKVLMENFGSAEKVWKAKEEILNKILERAVFEKFKSYRNSVDPEKILTSIYEKNIQVITIPDKEYPERLKQIFDPPPVLYVKGKLLPSDKLALAVVGTRRITGYGKEVTEILVRDLVSAGLTIVSGLARGVDSLAHKVALENGGRTIAVLGCGVDIVYPPQNTKLAAEIIQNGALISEYPPGTEPIPGHFPARNRIISGLALGTLVTEADEKSGSLITAGLALEQNREVFAVPGPIYSKLSAGPSSLIKQGAKLVTKAEDILEELKMSSELRVENSELKEIKGETKEEQRIINLLKNESKHVDQLSRETKVEPAKLASLLTTMELKGQIQNLGAGTYSLKR